MTGLIVFVLTVVAALAGFRISRRFVTEKLRYVDAVHSRLAPWAAAGGAVLLTVPLAALLPGFGAFGIILVAGAVGLGVARGAKDVRHTERLLAPWT
jgi:hypothetical protein